MPEITLPDGSVRRYDKPVTARQVAADIGPRLAKDALGCKIDGRLADLDEPIETDCGLAIVTPRARDKSLDPDALFLLRHSAAHVMAEAIQNLFPGVQLVYGPPTEGGFYYDMAFPEGVSISSDAFSKIEKEMERIIGADRPFTRYELSVDEGMKKLRDEGSKFKLDNAERAVHEGSDRLSWYATGSPGDDWEDLCRGPHVPSTGRIGAYKVMSLASSYWHGDENSDRLTRVYGTAFPSQQDLDAHLEQLEEARHRDHRALGRQLRLFHIDEDVGQGLILWTPRGAVVRNELQSFISDELRKQGYQQVYSPHIGKLALYKISGHFPFYQDSQYPPIVMRDSLAELAEEGCSCADLSNRMRDGEIEGYLLKPMNCPHHVKIFASEPHSYRDLPVRLAEFGTVYRWEQSGELNGMTRVRGFTQDDAHLFCTEDQVADEVRGCLDLVKIILSTLGITEYRVRVGLRDPDSTKYVGKPELWDRAEQACRDAARELGARFTEEPGEAAFYGPKIDFVVKDVIGREWQLGTVQVDYNLPERFDLHYIGADNKPHRPVMIHRAPFGSMERFVGVLIEHFAGNFPTWLAPEQVRILPMNDDLVPQAREIENTLKAAKVRVTVDAVADKLGAKIRRAEVEKVPHMLVLGKREADEGKVAVRSRANKALEGVKPLAEFTQQLLENIAAKTLPDPKESSV